MATSPGIIITFTGLDCKDSGQSGQSNFTYNFQIRIQNTTGVATPVTLLSATKCDASGDDALTNLNPSAFIAAPGTTTANIQADSTNSARDCFLLSYEVDGVVYVATFPGDGGSIKPCCTASEYCPCNSLSKPDEPGCTD